ncbi:MAG: DUF6377 domain-containing protein [Bacteroidales bacterium]|nr:DUF6377 domain-containing protein [Bacteroidales bacterium]
MDRTCTVATQARALADRLGVDTLLWKALMMQAEAEKAIGRYKESIKILDSIPREAYGPYANQIYSRYCSAYYSLEENTLPRSAAAPYKEKLIACRDTLAHILSGPSDRVINEIEYYKLIGDYKQAITAYRHYIAAYPEDSVTRPMYDFVVAEAYLANGDTELAKHLMLKTAIDDIKHSVKKYNALPTVAKILYSEGDYEHAYDYMMHSLMAVKESQAQSRMLRILDALPIIADAYNTQKRDEMRMRTVMLVLITVLAALVIAMLVLAYTRNKKLRRERERVERKNAELQALNNQVTDLNRQLRHSIREKEDYIGDLFNLCSEYINIMNRHYANAIKLVKKGATPAELEKQLGEIQNGYRLTSFFEQFDHILLSIFPDFVAKVNALLEPEYRYAPEPGRLTPELRIFALIRLGFTDTAKIASFLHFSPQTVYNYRFRARNHAIGGKEAFIEAIRTL